jgi:hypothetical protein
MADLQIGPDKVCFIIVKARELDAQEPVVEEDYGGNPIDEGFRGVLASYADDPTFQELRAFIEALNEDEQCELVALAWLGRGDYATDEWREALAAARSRRTGPTAEYLLGTPLLGDYLEEGLAAFGLSCAEVERDHL